MASAYDKEIRRAMAWLDGGDKLNASRLSDQAQFTFTRDRAGHADERLEAGVVEDLGYWLYGMVNTEQVTLRVDDVVLLAEGRFRVTRLVPVQVRGAFVGAQNVTLERLVA